MTAAKKDMGLGNFLKQKRKEKGLSQNKVAEELNIGSYQFVYNMESERILPPLKHIKALSKLYGISNFELRLRIVEHLLNKLMKRYGLTNDIKIKK